MSTSKQSDGQERIIANRERMRVAMARQFETDEDIASTLDAIMAGRFKGTLINGTEKYWGFRRPGMFRRTLHDGMTVNRFSHPDIRIARRDLGGYNWDGGLIGFDRDALAKLFASGMVVLGGPGYKAADRHANDIRKQIASERVGLLKASILAEADEERRPLLEQAFERLEGRSTDNTLQALQALAAMNAGTIAEAIVGNAMDAWSDNSASSVDSIISSVSDSYASSTSSM